MDARDIEHWHREARAKRILDRVDTMHAVRASGATHESYVEATHELEQLANRIRVGITMDQVIADNWDDLKAIKGE